MFFIFPKHEIGEVFFIFVQIKVKWFSISSNMAKIYGYKIFELNNVKMIAENNIHQGLQNLTAYE